MEGPRISFGDWLRDAIAAEGVSHRGLARRIAEKHPQGANETTIDSARRTLRKILHNDLNPTQPTRDAIQEALGRTDAPRVDDEERDEPLTREMLLERVRRGLHDLKALERAIADGRLAS